MSNYPPGVTGNEPQITGEWPCPQCGGAGGDFDEDGGHSCWFCAGTGIAPEEAPECPECGSRETEFAGPYDEWIECNDCGVVSGEIK